MKKLKNYGFRPEDVLIKPEDYNFGDNQLEGGVLQANGQWDEFLPLYEPQAEKYETSGCTCWGTLNALEILHKRLFKIEPNYSERFNYILSGVTLRGANPNNCCESIRKEGVIDQKYLPVPDTYEEFLTPKPMATRFLDLGKDWFKSYQFGHDWVLTGNDTLEERIIRIKTALQYSPLGASVTAWIEDKDGIYIDGGRPNNHWVCIYGWTDKGFKVFDSYTHEKKIVSYGHVIQFAKRFSLFKLKKKEGNWLSDLISRLFSWLK